MQECRSKYNTVIRHFFAGMQYRKNEIPVLHNSLMTGDRADRFDHSCVRVTKKICDLGRGKVRFFQLGTERRAPVG